jgi:uncharacterized membrane protein (UPF0127 family)
MLMFCHCEPVYAGSASVSGMGKIAIVIDSGRSGRTEKSDIKVVLNIQTVSELEEKRRGLSGMEKMPEDSGMMFVLDPDKQNYFWMKGMKFPLDILFFDRDRRLTGSFEGLFPCDECPVFSAPKGAAYGLEINAGTAGKYGVQRGDSFIVWEDEQK